MLPKIFSLWLSSDTKQTHVLRYVRIRGIERKRKNLFSRVYKGIAPDVRANPSKENKGKRKLTRKVYRGIERIATYKRLEEGRDQERKRNKQFDERQVSCADRRLHVNEATSLTSRVEKSASESSIVTSIMKNRISRANVSRAEFRAGSHQHSKYTHRSLVCTTAAANKKDPEARYPSDTLKMASSKPPEMNYTCEICGLEGFNDEEMRSHMVQYHLQGAANCPFCDLGEISPTEMLIHVNSAHLDYLTPSTPENDMMAFIDDDSLMDEHNRQDECRAPSPSMSLRPPHLQNGWGNSLGQRIKQQQQQMSPRQPDVQMANSNVNNNNNNNNSNNANAVLEGAAGQGSPLRSGLNLQLRSHASPKLPVQECPMCPYSSDSPLRLEEHINRQHFDLTSPSFPPESPPSRDGIFNCPLCITSFPNSSDLELHVNIEHKDILSPANGTTSQSDTATISSDSTPACPVCLSTLFKNNDDLMAHIDEHFSKKSTPSPVTPDVSTDRMLAKDMERREKEVRKLREQREFEMLRAQYGMDNQGNFREQSVTNMQRAVYAGEMTVADFFERQIELRVAESSGIDDGSSCTRGLVPKVRAISQACSNVVNTWMCSTVDHYASTYGDKGWGCGYRNMQMLISSLLQHTGYNELVYKAWSSGAGGNSSTENPLRSSMPSISRLQKMIEWAWAQGFDIQGAEQLGGKLVNTRKWIGATEVFTLLSSLRIKCQLVDFHRPTSADGSHPELFNWVLQYFQRCEDFKPPLYLQHQGHSRTIMGVEQLRDGSITMLVLDPSHSPAQMTHFNSTSSAPGAMRLVRKSTAAMKARQYQVVAVIGTMDTEAQYQQSKVLRSMRVPQDR